MKIVDKVKEMQNIVDIHKKRGDRIVCVPTMGYFHDGHLSLMKLAKDYGDVVIVTLFVNPTQFGPNEDYERYPRDFQRDFDLASSVGVDYLFVPSVEEMYPDGFSTKIIVTKFTDKFEGLKRIGHFDGVATVVAKIFNVTKPNVAIFGQKDFQQTLVVRQIVKDLLFDIEIVIAPTVRENDGLAMSSRNIYLSKEEREVASQIYQALLKGVEAINKHITNRKVISSIVQEHLAKFPQFVVDYVAVVNSENLSEPEEFKSGENVVILVAVFLGNTRLIDNLVATIP